MKTIIKTTIKGSENIYVTDSVESIFNELHQKGSFILLTSIGHDQKKSKIVIKKSSIKMIKS